MRFAQIRSTDIANGEGIRVSLYVQGCHRHCPNCFNPETWDFEGGKEFNLDTENILIELINKPHIMGLTILGGEPLEPENRKDIERLLKKVKRHCPTKNIWLYSSYLYEEIIEFDEDILSYIDVLVDGPFVESLKNQKLRFRGSSNQRIIDVQNSLNSKDILLYTGSRFYKV